MTAYYLSNQSHITVTQLASRSPLSRSAVTSGQSDSDRLLGVAAELPPPFVLLEDGRGAGASHLVWGSAARRRVEWSSDMAGAMRALADMSGADAWYGAVAYDLGLPPNAERRRPLVEQPLADLFLPTQRIAIDGPAHAARCHGAEAAERWAASASSAAAPVAAQADRGDRTGAPPLPPVRSFDERSFTSAVGRALAYIAAGDIYQVNLSVAERTPLADPPLEVYRRLRTINPSPWMGYADFGDWQLICGSPELLVEVRDGQALARPIAGTRKKTGEAAEDALMRRELATDTKEAAEHVMLVDLARNDLGRVAAFGSVAVTRMAAVEEYSHVMHLVSDVRARLRAEVGPFRVFEAMFPGGTITGVPKIRAMEIIAELEPVARGFYTGALGWTGRNGAQWNIVIRSAVVSGGCAVVQSGAGIVADSDPAREWKESLRKASAMRVALGLPPGP
jgi:para-aminobenzoate synthetase component 1